MKAKRHYPFFSVGTQAMIDDPLTVYKTHVGINVMVGDRTLFLMQAKAAQQFAEDILTKCPGSEYYIKPKLPPVSEELDALALEIEREEFFEFEDWHGLRVHAASKCAGQWCAVHNPSDHHMKDFPQHFRLDRGIMERTCPHGVGHPDPDDRTQDRTHGCCEQRCCFDG